MCLGDNKRCLTLFYPEGDKQDRGAEPRLIRKHVQNCSHKQDLEAGRLHVHFHSSNLACLLHKEAH